MGRGLVHPLDGFTARSQASHPELLDALANDFVQSKFNVHRLMKSILMSNAYQLSSKRAASRPGDDDQFVHALTQPMRWRQLFNSLMRTTGLEESVPDQPVWRKGDLWAGMMHGVDPSIRSDRTDDPNRMEPTIAQALFFLNGLFVNAATRGEEPKNFRDGDGVGVRFQREDLQRLRLNLILKKETSPRRIVEELYLSTLSRLPTKREQMLILKYLGKYRHRVAAYEDVFWALVNSTEFVTRH